MSPVVATGAGVFVMPMFVVDRDLHFGRIPVVHAVAATIIIVAAKILWIKNVRIVVEPRTVSISRGWPKRSVGHRLGAIGIAIPATRVAGSVRSELNLRCT